MVSLKKPSWALGLGEPEGLERARQCEPWGSEGTSFLGNSACSLQLPPAVHGDIQQTRLRWPEVDRQCPHWGLGPSHPAVGSRPGRSLRRPRALHARRRPASRLQGPQDGGGSPEQGPCVTGLLLPSPASLTPQTFPFQPHTFLGCPQDPAVSLRPPAAPSPTWPLLPVSPRGARVEGRTPRAPGTSCPSSHGVFVPPPLAQRKTPFLSAGSLTRACVARGQLGQVSFPSSQSCSPAAGPAASGLRSLGDALTRDFPLLSLPPRA